MEEIKSMFNRNIQIILDKKANNTKLFSHEVYCRFIDEIKAAKVKSKKVPLDYRRLARFDVVVVDGLEKLIQPVTTENPRILYYLEQSELFEVLHQTHLSIGHGGRTRMLKELQKKYKNITKEIIMIYLALCKPCQQKQCMPKKNLVSKPLLSEELNYRCQVNVIDMQSKTDGEYKFILNYQDHLTKFIFLKPLKTNTAAEVAHNLLDIFTTIGAPNVLQSDNGREFANHIINELTDRWADLKIVHGKTRHSENQGSVEKANQDVQNMLATWMQSSNNNHWAEGLRFIQLMKNRAYHDGIRQSPYEAMFGCKARVGIWDSYFPNDVIASLQTEEDLKKANDDFRKNHCSEQLTDNLDECHRKDTEEPFTEDSVPNKEMSLREASSAQSLSDGQVSTQCYCIKKRKSNRSKCPVYFHLCNTKCHKSTDCCNK